MPCALLWSPGLPAESSYKADSNLSPMLDRSLRRDLLVCTDQVAQLHPALLPGSGPPAWLSAERNFSRTIKFTVPTLDGGCRGSTRRGGNSGNGGSPGGGKTVSTGRGMDRHRRAGPLVAGLVTLWQLSKNRVQIVPADTPGRRYLLRHISFGSDSRGFPNIAGWSQSWNSWPSGEKPSPWSPWNSASQAGFFTWVGPFPWSTAPRRW